MNECKKCDFKNPVNYVKEKNIFWDFNYGQTCFIFGMKIIMREYFYFSNLKIILEFYKKSLLSI